VTGVHGGNGPSRVSVYFLDTDLPDNAPADRLITQYLYGGDQHTRISQEAILGIGGYLAFKRLEPNITTYHMNEGHAVFLTLAMLKDLDGNVEQVKSRCVFTTHTPVPAGHDKFGYELAGKMIGEYLPPDIKKLAGEDLLNTTVLALNLSRAANGVSQLHGEISRQMFPGFDIGHVTNGVHHLSWTSPEFKKLYDKYIPTWRTDPQQLADISHIPDGEIVETKKQAKKRLISYINGLSDAGFTEERLTICFARRAAAYKRATLIFSDLEFLFNLSYDRVQFVFAGKAHPQDTLGKELIKQVVNIGKQYENQLKLVFVPNYNIWAASLMTAGADVWLNTPRRPREASGTSGMKVCFNGGVNMSVLDGWWREVCKNRVNGWAIGDDEDQDDHLAASDLYQDLEDMVTTYYANPRKWLSVMRHSISDITPYFNTHRMVMEYYRNYYR
jgi:starch phosphorylase